MKRLVTMITHAILLAGFILLGISNTHTAIADTSTPDNEVANGITKAINSSVSATITITMYAVANG